MSDIRLSVLLPLPLAGPLDYVADRELEPGTIVRVPLSGREVWGVVWPASGAASGKVLALDKLKPLLDVAPGPPLKSSLCRFVDWVADYTLSPPGSVLRMVLSTPQALKPAPTRTLYRLTGDEPQRMTPARAAVLEVMAARDLMSLADIKAEAQVSDGVIRGLVGQSALQGVTVAADAPFERPDPDAPGPVLSTEQSVAATALAGLVWEQRYQTVLLEGVTGAGKTEVYFEAIAEVLKATADKEPGQALVMLPEIALTAQWLERFEARFGAAPTVWHSELGQAGRRRAWNAVRSGDARVVVGARSALFLPFADLQLIVVDEEHDQSFKQEEGVIYHARDMAVVRGSLDHFPVVLASATPSLETLVNADAGRYLHFQLLERHGGAALPHIRAVDMRVDGPEPGRWLSPPLVAAVHERLARAEQSLLFLNRRGYAPLTLCRACGERIDCPRCTAWLVEHRYTRTLDCHHCGHSIPIPKACPSCEAEDTLAACGPGVERLEEEVKSRFPDARVAQVSSDVLMSTAHMKELVREIEAGALDIIIGTQLITKGYHFPNLTLVGVVDADLGLKGGDLRGGERTYQQLVQVAGRAGRAQKPGEVLLQTYMPEHPVTEALISGNPGSFLAAERDARRRLSMPPFGKLAALILSGESEAEIVHAGRRLAATAPFSATVQVLGPAPAPLAMIRGRHRHRLLVKATREVKMQPLIRDWLQRAGRLKGVRVKVDIDPMSFL